MSPSANTFTYSFFSFSRLSYFIIHVDVISLLCLFYRTSVCLHLGLFVCLFLRVINVPLTNRNKTE